MVLARSKLEVWVQPTFCLLCRHGTHISTVLRFLALGVLDPNWSTDRAIRWSETTIVDEW